MFDCGVIVVKMGGGCGGVSFYIIFLSVLNFVVNVFIKDDKFCSKCVVLDEEIL